MAEKLYRGTPRGREEIPEDEAAKIRAEWAANEVEAQATQYSRDRQDTYPSWQDQLDQIYHEGIDAWKVSVKKIKDDNPKP